MTSIPPTERICEAINEFLSNGLNGNHDVMNTLFRLGAQRLIQELLEQEVTDHLGRDRYERSEEGTKGFRNGYKKRQLNSAEGKNRCIFPSLETLKKLTALNYGNSSKGIATLCSIW